MESGTTFRIKKIFILLLVLTLGLTSCSGGPDVSTPESVEFKEYVVKESKRIAESWDCCVQPLLGNADPGSSEWSKDFISYMKAFSIVTTMASDEMPGEAGIYTNESLEFKNAVDSLTDNTTQAWMALQNGNPSGLSRALQAIQEAFSMLTEVVSKISANKDKK